MAISIYDQPAQAEFMQTHVPLPFQELAAAGQQQQRRWEEHDAMVRQSQSALGQINALEGVTDAYGNPIEYKEADIVQEKQDEYEQRFNELASTVEDKSSPEYRSKAISIIQDLRNDMGPRGVFGKAEANVKRWQDILKKREEAELGAKPYRAMAQDEQLRRYAELSERGEIGTLSADAPMLKDIDVHGKLRDTLDKVNETILTNAQGGSFAGLSRDEIEGQIRKEGHVRGISRERIKGITKRLINEDPELRTDLRARAEAAGMSEEEFEQSVDSLADTMAATYRTEDQDISWASDPLAVSRAKRKDELESQVWSSKANLPMETAHIPDNHNQLEAVKEERENRVDSLRDEAIISLKENYGIDQSMIETRRDGTIDLRNIEEVEGYVESGQEGYNPADISREVFKFNNRIKQAQKNAKQVERLRKNAMREAGLTEEDFRKYKDLTGIMGGGDKSAMFTYGGPPGTIVRNRGPLPGDEQGKKPSGITEEEIDEFSNKFDKYQKYLKKNADRSNTQNVSLIHMPEDINEKMNERFQKDKGIVGYEWADTEKGTGVVDQDELSEMKEAKFNSFFVDYEDGRLKALYNTYDDDKNHLGTVKREIPEGADKFMYKHGFMDEINTMITQELYKEDGIMRGVHGAVGSFELPLTGEKVEFKGRDNNGQIIVEVPTDGGENLVEGFSNESELIGFLNNLSKNVFIDQQQSSAESE